MLSVKGTIKKAAAEYFEPVFYARDLAIGGRAFAGRAAEMRTEIAAATGSAARGELTSRYKGLRQTHGL